MRLLDRYLFREFLIVFGYCLAGFLVFWISFDLISDLDDFRDDGMSAGDVALYYGIITPKFMTVVLPVALLLSLLYTLSQLARHNEIVAMRAAGVGIWRITAPYLGAGFVLSVVLMLINELWAPRAEAWAEEIRRGRADGEREATRRHHFVKFVSRKGNRHEWNADWFDPKAATFGPCRVVWTDAGSDWTRVIVADEARWNGASWDFVGASYFRGIGGGPQDGDPNGAEAARGEFQETPAEIASEIEISQLTGSLAVKRPVLPLRSILNHRRLNPEMEPRRKALVDTQFYSRLAEPWTCLVVVLMAIPFGAASGRRNVVVGVAASVFLAFGYFVLMRFGLALGAAGHVWPWLATWSPNLVFGAAGVWWTATAR